MNVKLTIGLLLTVAAPAQAAPDKYQRQLEALATRTPSDVETLVQVKGDNLDPAITISSYGVTQITNKGLVTSTSRETSFLRAFIDKKSGTISAQIYHVAYYGGRNWNFFTRATYETDSGPTEVDVVRIDSDVSCFRYGCSYVEDIGVPVEFAALEQAASHFDPAKPMAGLHYRIFAKSGVTVDEVIPGNELVAFVNVVRRQVATMKHG